MGKKDGQYHFFSDASINVTGGIGMLAGCCIQNMHLRQHLQAPDAHASEMVAAGTNIHAILPVNGLVQEVGLHMGEPTTTYFDSISTVFVASSDATHSSNSEGDHCSLMLSAPPASHTQSLSAARRSALWFTVHSVKPESAAPSLS